MQIRQKYLNNPLRKLGIF